MERQVETAARIQQLKEQQQELSILANGYEAADQMEQTATQRLDYILRLQELWQSRLTWL